MGKLEAASRPLLLYRATCPRCRRLSRMVVALSGGAIQRIANDSDEARAIYAAHDAPVGKLALRYRGRWHVGRRVFAVTWAAIARAWLERRS